MEYHWKVSGLIFVFQYEIMFTLGEWLTNWSECKFKFTCKEVCGQCLQIEIK